MTIPFVDSFISLLRSVSCDVLGAVKEILRLAERSSEAYHVLVTDLEKNLAILSGLLFNKCMVNKQALMVVVDGIVSAAKKIAISSCRASIDTLTYFQLLLLHEATQKSSLFTNPNLVASCELREIIINSSQQALYKSMGLTVVITAVLEFLNVFDEIKNLDENDPMRGKIIGAAVGTIAGSVVGGAIGQTLIPVPVMGFAVGSLIGNVTGRVLGRFIAS